MTTMNAMSKTQMEWYSNERKRGEKNRTERNIFISLLVGPGLDSMSPDMRSRQTRITRERTIRRRQTMTFLNKT